MWAGGPPNTSTRRSGPAMAGTRTSATSARGAPPGRPGGAGRGVDCHLAPAGSSCELIGVATDAAAGMRCSRHKE